MAEKKKTNWHRLLGLILEPMFQILGYKTKIEYDLTKKQQFIDLIVIEHDRKKSSNPALPKQYWECFGKLNRYNLISFKSYSESFNGFAMLELFGHYISFLKEKELDENLVNLYVITNHEPKKLLKEYKAAGWVTVIIPNQVVELRLPEAKTIRFLLTQETENPVLSLFSGDKERVKTAYAALKQETTLLDRISGYFSELLKYYKMEILMYTKEDFFRENPPGSQPHFCFPWEEEFHKKEMLRLEIRRKEEETKRREEETKRKAAEEKAKNAELMLKELYDEGILTEEQYLTRVASLKK